MKNKIEDFIFESNSIIINIFNKLFKIDEAIFDNKIITKKNENKNLMTKNIENDCINFLNKYLKERFVNAYTDVINEQSKSLIKIVNEQKEILRLQLYDLLTIETEDILKEINKKIEKTKKSIEEYTNYSKNFSISNEFINFLSNYGTNNIEPLFRNILELIIGASKNNILYEIEKNSKEYENDLNSKKFINFSNSIFYNLKNNYIDNMFKYINN